MPEWMKLLLSQIPRNAADEGAGDPPADGGGEPPAADAGKTLLGDEPAAADPAGEPPNEGEGAKAEGEGEQKKADDKKAEIPEAYEVAVEGVETDAAALEYFTPVFKDLGLSNEQANKLAAANHKHTLETWGKISKDFADKAKADPEIGGAKFDETLASAKLAVTELGTPAFREMMNTFAVGNHPEMIRFMAKVGSFVQHQIHSGSGQSLGAATAQAL